MTRTGAAPEESGGSPAAASPDSVFSPASSSSSPSSSSSSQRPERVCPNCGRVLLERKCKLLCPSVECGYYMSCSDFY